MENPGARRIAKLRKSCSPFTQSPPLRTAIFTRLAPIALLAALFAAAPLRAAMAQATAPSLGDAQSFAVLGATTVTNTGPSVITGDLGVSPGTAVTGFPPGTVVGGTIHSNDAPAINAQSANLVAYGSLASQACNNPISTDLSGLTLAPGVYCFSSSASLATTGTLRLDGGGNPNAVWVFQIGSALITGSGSSVVLINGAQNCNVFWQVGSSATIGTGSTFVGNILANTSVTLTTGAIVSGRALAYTGAVTLDSNQVAVSTCNSSVGLLPPTVSKAFNPAIINAGGSSALTITLSNANAAAATGAGFTDSLPSGLSAGSVSSNTCGGTASTTASTVTLAGGTIPAGGSCVVTISVTAANAGSYINSLAIGALTTSNGSNAGPAVATLTVNTVAGSPIPPTIGKAFSLATISAGGTSTLTITLTNPDPSTPASDAGFTDTLPSGVLVSGVVSNGCGGTLTAPPASPTVNLAGGSIGTNSSCDVVVDVTAAVAGSYFNSIAAGALVTGNGSNAAPAIATLTVIAPVSGAAAPSISKAFSPPTTDAPATSTLTITLTNAGTVADSAASLTDPLPTGMVVATPPNASNTCSGSFAPLAGDSAVTLTGGTIPLSGSCVLTVDVTAAVAGNYINSLAVGALSSDNGSNAGASIATLTANAATILPTVAKAFSPATINAGGTSALTITLTNANSTAATLTAPFTDTLPIGLVVSGNASTTCGGTAPTTTTSTVTLPVGDSIPAGDCTVTVNVTAAAAGSYSNSLAIGALQTSNGISASVAVASLTVNTNVTITKSFSPASIKPGGVATLTITLTNATSTVAKLTAPLVDNLPKGLVVSSVGSTNCGGKYSSKQGGTSVTITGGSIPANSSRTVTVYVTAAYAGSYVNTLPVGALQTNLGSNIAAAVATLTVGTVKPTPTPKPTYTPTPVPTYTPKATPTPKGKSYY